MKFEKSCGAVVFRNVKGTIEFLSIRSKAPNSYWGFPKGHVEENETEEETCMREVFEETGLNISIYEGFRTEVNYLLSEDTHKEVIFFIGKISNENVTIQEEEVQEYRWATYEEIYELLTFDSVKNVLREVRNFLVTGKEK